MIASLMQFWQRLWHDPEYQDLWISRIVTSVVIVLVWHVWDLYNRREAARARERKQLSLTPESLPTDLVLREETTTEATESTSDKQKITKKDPPKNKKVKKKQAAKKQEKPVSRLLQEQQRQVTTTQQMATAGTSPKTKGTKARPNPQSEERQQQSPRGSPRRSVTATTRRANASASSSSSTTPVPKMLPERVSLEGFWNWCDVQASLFRSYTIPSVDSSTVATPFQNPNSRRGTVPVQLAVTNQLSSATTIQVYWIDYKGRRVQRGTIRFRETWYQTTWYDHPWVFCCETSSESGEDVVEQQDLLHYVPYRVIPTVPPYAVTTDPTDPHRGLHRFAIRAPQSHPNPVHSDKAVCRIDDPILPHPAHQHLTTHETSLDWALLHATRMDFDDWDLLLRYLRNCLEPLPLSASANNSDASNETTTTTSPTANNNNQKYRLIRTSNRHFGPRLWQTSARGILLTVGFFEHAGHVQMGGPSGLSLKLQSNLRAWIGRIEHWIHHRQQMDRQHDTSSQPEGADGFGRAGYGRAGVMN